MKGFNLFKQFFCESLSLLLESKKEFRNYFLILFLLSFISILLDVFLSDSESFLFITIKFIFMALPVIPIVKVIALFESTRRYKIDFSSSAITFFLGSLVYSLLFVGGALLFIIPGIFTLTAFYFLPFVAVYEDVGIIESMKRSYLLLKKDFALVVTVSILTLILELSGEITAFIPSVGMKLGIGFILSIIDALFSILFILTSVKIYHHLKSN